MTVCGSELERLLEALRVGEHIDVREHVRRVGVLRGARDLGEPLDRRILVARLVPRGPVEAGPVELLDGTLDQLLATGTLDAGSNTTRSKRAFTPARNSRSTLLFVRVRANSGGATKTSVFASSSSATASMLLSAVSITLPSRKPS